MRETEKKTNCWINLKLIYLDILNNCRILAV